VLVTAALLAFSVTPLLPWWLTLLGTAFAVLLGKHAFGGLGQNPFNPAMVGYALLLVSFPAEMTRWPVPLDAGTHSWLELARLDVERGARVRRLGHHHLGVQVLRHGGPLRGSAGPPFVRVLRLQR
jgi:Na+-translocating ferredoxin:NAD+ oxidoreductase RnfD subunit